MHLDTLKPQTPYLPQKCENNQIDHVLCRCMAAEAKAREKAAKAQEREREKKAQRAAEQCILTHSSLRPHVQPKSARTIRLVVSCAGAWLQRPRPGRKQLRQRSASVIKSHSAHHCPVSDLHESSSQLDTKGTVGAWPRRPRPERKQPRQRRARKSHSAQPSSAFVAYTGTGLCSVLP